MAAQDRKRPWYLVVALSVALGLGMMSAFNGCALFAFYRAPADAIVATPAAREIADDDDRAAVQARFEAYVGALDGAKRTGWPLSVAMLLLGSGTVFFAMRTIGGSSGGRAALVQLVFVQAALAPLSAWLLRDVHEANLRYESALASATVRESVLGKRESESAARLSDRIRRAGGPIELVMHTLGSAFVLVGLTRRRARAVFDEAAAAVEER